MHREAQEGLAKDETDFRNLIFANNPKLYQSIFKDEFEDEEAFLENEDFEWIVPKTEADVAKMMADLDQAMGG